jgi:hypothetical protein
MNITLSLNKQPPAANQKTRIVNRLNALLDSTSFFSWPNERLQAGTCSNTRLHNKLIIFLAIFIDSHAREFDGETTSWTCFGVSGSGDSGMSFQIHTSLMDQLEDAINSIDSIANINITTK